MKLRGGLTFRGYCIEVGQKVLINVTTSGKVLQA